MAEDGQKKTELARAAVGARPLAERTRSLSDPALLERFRQKLEAQRAMAEKLTAAELAKRSVRQLSGSGIGQRQSVRSVATPELEQTKTRNAAGPRASTGESSDAATAPAAPRLRKRQRREEKKRESKS
jgi:hypothetical protein